jgi:NAD(P)-dependent dehydrogenase (short-subunit alcohol dehydrogenase family)
MKEDKNVISFGSSQGIGEALAYEYALHGTNLVLLSRNSEAIQRISDEINSKGGKSFFHGCDVSQLEEVREGIDYSLSKLGTIDLVIINSGMTIRQWVKDFNSENFKKVFETNTYGIAHALECLIPIMKKQGYGKIAGVTSLADVRGYPGSSAYSASKAAATRLLESARIELKKFNIRVITVKPGFVKTPMTDKNEFIMPFMIKAKKAAKIIRKGIRKGKSIVGFTRGTVILTKMAEFAPNWLFDPALRILRGKK